MMLIEPDKSTIPSDHECPWPGEQSSVHMTFREDCSPRMRTWVDGGLWRCDVCGQHWAGYGYYWWACSYRKVQRILRRTQKQRGMI